MLAPWGSTGALLRSNLPPLDHCCCICPPAYTPRPDSVIKMDNFYSVTVYEKVRTACCRDVSTLLLWDGFGASALGARGGGVFWGGGD